MRSAHETSQIFEVILPESTSLPSSPLRYATPKDWLKAVLNDFDTFMQDHAAAEKKASGMAMSMISHYPDRLALVEVMADLAVEELNHFKEVVKWLHKRGLQLTADRKDHYVLAMRKHMRNGSDVYLLDRLLIGGIIEARGCERFGLVASALNSDNAEASQLKSFYQAITRSEARHYQVFVNLAELYFDQPLVNARLDELLDIEAAITAELDISSALH